MQKINKTFSAKLLSGQLAPSLYWQVGLSHFRCRALHLPLLIFMRFLSVNFCSLSRALWIAALPFSLLTSPPVCYYLGLYLETLNDVGLSVDPWGMRLLTDCWLDLCHWSQSSEPGGPTNYPPLVFHLLKPYPFCLTIKVEWQTVGGCVTGHAKVRGYDVMFFPSSTEPVISSWEALWLVRYHLPLVNPSRLFPLPFYPWRTVTAKAVMPSAFNKKIKTARHLKCYVLSMVLTLPMH